jgi:hypothetical protein
MMSLSIHQLNQEEGVLTMENNISIASSAMLVEMSISTWTARKLDKKVSAEVDVSKGTKTNAGNYNKNLLAGTGFLDTIIKYAANARAWHISQTLPWSDNGLRLLPVSNFINYKKQLTVLEDNYMALVDKFILAYPNLVSAAAFQLGDLFNRDEYPDVDKIASRFKFNVNFMPVPTGGDFRIDIEDYIKSEVMQSCNLAYEERLNNAMRHAWDRLHECLVRMSDRLAVDEVNEDDNDGMSGTKAKPRVFRNTLVENAVELVDMLKHFNLTNDPTLEQARLDLHNAIMHQDADSLRDNLHAREQVKHKVDAILSKFNF